MNSAASLTFRNAEEGDSKLLFTWANDPDVRISSLSPEPIEWEHHEQWFASRLKDPHSRIYIASDGDTPIGQIRFDLKEGNIANVDVHTAKESRGKGYGTPLITGGLERLFADTDTQEVHAFIKPTNAPSISVFTKAGFHHEGETELKEQEVYQFIFRRS